MCIRDRAYVHRIGRTARAGRAGDAILFVAPREMRMLRAIEKATRQTLEPMQPPTREAIAGRRVAQFKPVSYTHLDVYKRQTMSWARRRPAPARLPPLPCRFWKD